MISQKNVCHIESAKFFQDKFTALLTRIIDFLFVRVTVTSIAGLKRI